MHMFLNHLVCYENENLEKRESPDPAASVAGLGWTSVEDRKACWHFCICNCNLNCLDSVCISLMILNNCYLQFWTSSFVIELLENFKNQWKKPKNKFPIWRQLVSCFRDRVSKMKLSHVLLKYYELQQQQHGPIPRFI